MSGTQWRNLIKAIIDIMYLAPCVRCVEKLILVRSFFDCNHQLYLIT